MHGAVPRPAHRPAAPCSRSTTSPSPTAPSRCSTTSTFDVGRGERLLSWASTAPARPACCASSPASPSPTSARSRFGHNVVARLLRPGARGHHRGPHAARPHARGVARLGGRDPRGLLGMFGLSGDKVFQDAGDAVGRREDEARPGPARRRPPQPAAARRAHQQPRPAARATAMADALGGVAGHDGARQPRRRVRRARSRPTGCCSCPRATSATGATTCSTWSPWPDPARRPSPSPDRVGFAP